MNNKYDLLTDNLVESAVKADFGHGTTLDKYEVVDFCETGENFQSIVTSIKVNVIVYLS